MYERFLVSNGILLEVAILKKIIRFVILFFVGVMVLQSLGPYSVKADNGSADPRRGYHPHARYLFNHDRRCNPRG